LSELRRQLAKDHDDGFKKVCLPARPRHHYFSSQ
jgi:hypothetical protein